MVLTGGRGVGTTVLLGAAAELADERHGWLTVSVEIRAETPFRPQLIERLVVAAELYRQTPEKRTTVTAATLRASVLGVGGEVEVSRRERPVPMPAMPLASAPRRPGQLWRFVNREAMARNSMPILLGESGRSRRHRRFRARSS